MKKLSLRVKLIVSYVVITLIVILLTTVLTYANTSSVMTNKVGVLTTAINDQMRLNINNFQSDIEDVCALTFSDAEMRNFTATDSSIDEYEKIQLEAAISEKLLNNSLLKNFGDFGIVYSDNTTVGRISSSTMGVLGTEGLYDILAGNISNETTNDGWFTGVDGSFKRLYYVKRINADAILLTSVYTAELETVLEFSDQLNAVRKNMTVWWLRMARV